jgi:hypothetical protein
LIRRGSTALLTLALLGCIDFAEPDLPEAGNPAVIQVILHLDDLGGLDASAVLMPGLTIEGIPRTVPNDTLRVLGLPAKPVEIQPNGTRNYLLLSSIAGPQPGARAITIAPPAIATLAAPTSIEWQGLRRLDPDTIPIAAGADATLHVELMPPAANPAPASRSWNIDLISPEGNFRFGASGVPPTSIRIPSFWLPATSNGRVTAFLTYFQSGVYHPAPGDYTVSAGVDVRIRWTLRILPTP